MLLDGIDHRFGRCISSEIVIAAIALGYGQLANDVFLLNFMSENDILDALIKDVEEGHQEIFRWLSTFRPDKININSVDSVYNRTILHAAAWSGDKSLVSELLRIGANPDSQDYFGRSPLHIAAIRRNVSLAQILLDWGADVNLQDHARHRSLHYAINSLQVIRMLLSNGAEVRKNDIAMCRRSPTVRFLLMEAERSQNRVRPITNI